MGFPEARRNRRRKKKKMKTAFIVVLALCATLAAAHDKMTVPITRTGTEVTVNGGDGVCDAAPDNNNVPNSANAGDTINIQWDGNHGGPWTVTWAKMSDSTDEAILDENRRTIQNGLSTSLRWPSNLETGTYTVQWTWSNYRAAFKRSQANKKAAAKPKKKTTKNKTVKKKTTKKSNAKKSKVAAKKKRGAAKKKARGKKSKK